MPTFSLNPPALPATDTNERYEQLLEWFRRFEQVSVAYSGGVDSSFVLFAARAALGPDRVIAVTADSPSLARDELAAAKELAASLGVSHRIIMTTELEDPRYAANRGDRCYYCKQNLYETLARELPHLHPSSGPTTAVVDGANADDRSDIRPGARAAAEAGIRHPLDELGWTKEEVRRESRRLGLRTWDKPAMACLSSRLAQGVAVTAERLQMIETVESFLSSRGIDGARVRLHLLEAQPEPLALARIELPDTDRPIAFREELVEIARAAGFAFVTLDLEGYKRGGRPATLPRRPRPPRDPSKGGDR